MYSAACPTHFFPWSRRLSGPEQRLRVRPSLLHSTTAATTQCPTNPPRNPCNHLLAAPQHYQQGPPALSHPPAANHWPDCVTGLERRRTHCPHPFSTPTLTTTSTPPPTHPPGSSAPRSCPAGWPPPLRSPTPRRRCTVDHAPVNAVVLRPCAMPVRRATVGVTPCTSSCYTCQPGGVYRAAHSVVFWQQSKMVQLS